jgi:lipid-A-disaccharide synthase
VLCVLPFEEQWFTERKVPARFIGHPAVNRTIDLAALRDRMHGLPQGAPRLGLFPGSRGHEVRANTGLLVDVYTELQGRHAGMCGVIVAANPQIARTIRRRVSVFPTGLHMITGSSDAVIAWCDLALAVSGTITLDIAAHRKPMIGVYKTGLPTWILAKLLVRSPYRLLPNIIAEREVVPEFAPHLGGPAPIVKKASRILLDSKHGAVQSEELHRVCLRFANHDPAVEAAKGIMEQIREAITPLPSRSVIPNVRMLGEPTGSPRWRQRSSHAARSCSAVERSSANRMISRPECRMPRLRLSLVTSAPTVARSCEA